jgi:hypothetical protein
MSLREGRTSSRAGGPGVRHAVLGSPFAGAALAAAAGCGAEPLLTMGRKNRVRRTLAVQF